MQIRLAARRLLPLLLPLLCALLLTAVRAAEPDDPSPRLIDLHAHTTLSDGSDTPLQLVQRAASVGVTTLAFTEHDQLSYSPAAIEWAQQHGIDIIQGTELSCEWSFQLQTHTIGDAKSKTLKPHRASKVHLLGYFTRADPDSPLARLLADLQAKRTSRNQIILDELQRKFGIAITAEEVVRAAREAKRKDKAAASAKLKAGEGPSAQSAPSKDDVDAELGIEYLGRPHIAMALIAAGHARSISDAFARFLSDEALPLPAWSLELGAAVQAIAQHGGVAVMAHPVTIGLGMQELEQELSLLLATTSGRHLRGLEVFSSKHTAAQSRSLLGIAQRLGLIPTGGSDFHGSNKEGVPLARFGLGEDAEINTRAWATLSAQSLKGMRDLKAAIEAAATATRGRGQRREGEGTGSLAEVTAILHQLALYAALILALLAGARLFEAPLPPQFVASGGGARMALIRAVKRNAACAWMYGSVGSPSPLHARNEDPEAAVEVRTTTIAVRGPSSSVASVASVHAGDTLAAPVAAPSLLDLESPPATPLPPALRGLSGPVIRTTSAASSASAAGMSHQLGMVSPAVATIGVGALHSNAGPRAPPASPASHASPPNRSLSQFLFCFLGLQLSYLSWGYLQERIMTLEYAHASSAEGVAHGVEAESNRFSHSEFLVLLNRVFGGVIAFVVLIVQRIRAAPEQGAGGAAGGGSGGLSSSAAGVGGLRAHCLAVLAHIRAIPPYRYSLCSLSNILSSWFQYEALKYISFPLQVLSKSSKIAVTMLASTVIEGARFPLRDYASAAAIAGGMLAFRLGEHLSAAGGGELPAEDASSALPASPAVDSSLLSLLGFLLLAGYIVADSFTSTWQSRIFRESAKACSVAAAAGTAGAAAPAPISSVDMMLGTNLFSSVFSLCIMVAFGKLGPALRFGWSHPLSLVHAAWMSLFSSVGQLFIFHTISSFGAVSFASMMTARQLLSLGLSIVAFGHHVHTIGWIGLAMVAAAMGAKMVQDVRKQQQQNKTGPGTGGAASTPAGKERKMDEAAAATTLEMQRLNPTARD